MQVVKFHSAIWIYLPPPPPKKLVLGLKRGQFSVAFHPLGQTIFCMQIGVYKSLMVASSWRLAGSLEKRKGMYVYFICLHCWRGGGEHYAEGKPAEGQAAKKQLVGAALNTLVLP